MLQHVRATIAALLRWLWRNGDLILAVLVSTWAIWNERKEALDSTAAALAAALVFVTVALGRLRFVIGRFEGRQWVEPLALSGGLVDSKDLTTAQEIWFHAPMSVSTLVGKDATQTARLLEMLVHRDVKFAVLYSNPDASTYLATRFPSAKRSRAEAARIRELIGGELEALATLMEESPEARIDVSVSDYPQTHGLIARNPDRSSGRLVVTLHEYSPVSGEAPSIALDRRRHPKSYRHFLDEAARLQKHGAVSQSSAEIRQTLQESGRGEALSPQRRRRG